MAVFLDVLLPAELLEYWLNAALASLAACAIAIALSRRTRWSLPLRHALLVAALGVSLLAPLVIPWFQPPSLWSIRAAELPDRPPHSADTAPRATSYPREAEEPQGSESLSTQVAEATAGRPKTAGGVATRPISV